MVYNPGETIIFTCNSGYNASATTATCQTTTFWLPEPSCTLVLCTTPSLQNGYYLINEYLAGPTPQFGTIIHPQCKEGYTPTNSVNRTCTESGHWSGSDPECRAIICSWLPSVQNGHYDVGEHTPQFTYNYTISLVCEPGYKASDTDEHRQCITTNTWSGQNSTCIRITCEQPQAYEQVIYNTSKSSYDFGSVIFPSCQKGFYMANDVTTRMCIDMNIWSNSEPVCKIAKCPQPVVSNGSFVPSDYLYTYNKSITIHCNAGFEIKEGIYIQTCNEHGTWGPDNLQCERVRCNSAADIHHEAVIDFPQHLFFGEVANVTYNTDFFVLQNGSTEVTCSSAKMLAWTSTPDFGKNIVFQSMYVKASLHIY